MNGTTVSFSEGRALTLMLELSEIERINSPWNGWINRRRSAGVAVSAVLDISFRASTSRQYEPRLLCTKVELAESQQLGSRMGRD